MLPDEILSDVKNYLDITWEDEETDKKIIGIIARGMNYINAKGGGDFDYSKENSSRSLLFDFAMYARANALDDFYKNYMSEILSLQLKTRVENVEEE